MADTQESYLKRIWFVPRKGSEMWHTRCVNWGNDFSTINISEIEELSDKPFAMILSRPHIFMVRSPLTFGHSQVRIPIPPNKPNTTEIDYWQWAALMIKKAIKVNIEAFVVKQLHLHNSFSELAKETQTWGDYIKTLVWRGSAEENQEEEYRVHLIPYFESHEKLCNEYFDQLYLKGNKKEGGLLGWISEREKVVDKREIENEGGVEDLVEIWRLPLLASQFKTFWNKEE